MKCLSLTVAIVLLFAAHAAWGKVITLESLLDEMLDRDALARLDEPAYVTRQAGSYQRLSVAPDQDGWYANQDWSHFIRKEQKDGQTEWVMLDAKGPGCIVRFWMGGEAQYGKLRFYLNDAKLGEAIDLYNSSVITTGGTSLGTVTLQEGPAKCRVRIVGANPRAVKRHMLGLDYIKLIKK
jgi:hypothetical protein